jgi:chromosome segregation ATPase
MRFDYPYTCSKIDKEIDATKDTIFSGIKDYLEQACPLLGEDLVNMQARKWSEDLYDDISSSFETVRKINEDMREEATNQIRNLSEEVDDQKHNVNKLEEDLSKKESKIDDLEYEIIELNKRIESKDREIDFFIQEIENLKRPNWFPQGMNQ